MGLAQAGFPSRRTRIQSEVYVLRRKKRSAYAILYHYRPQFYFRTTDGTAPVSLPQGSGMVMPVTMSRSKSKSRACSQEKRPALRHP